jgi:hypothetical protein
MPGSTAFAASTLVRAALSTADSGDASRSEDKSINAREFVMLLEDLGVMDGSLSVREAIKVY